MQKMFSKINNRPESNGATTSTDSSAAQNTQRPPYMDENESSAEQRYSTVLSGIIETFVPDKNVLCCVSVVMLLSVD